MALHKQEGDTLYALLCRHIRDRDTASPNTHDMSTWPAYDGLAAPPCIAKPRAAATLCRRGYPHPPQEST